MVLFYIVDNKTELDFDLYIALRKIIDAGTGDRLAVFADNTKQEYEKKVGSYFGKLALTSP